MDRGEFVLEDYRPLVFEKDKKIESIFHVFYYKFIDEIIRW